MTSTVLAGLPANVLAGARALGLDADAMMRGAGLLADDLVDPDARVPEAKFLAVLDAIEEQEQVPDFGLRLSDLFRFEVLGAVGYAIGAADDLEHVFTTLERFARLLHAEAAHEYVRTETEIRFGRALDPRYARMRHATSHALAGTLVIARTLTGRDDLIPTRVQLQHPRPPNGASYDAYFGVAVEFASDATSISFPASAGSWRVVRNDPSLFAYLARHAESMLARLPRREPTTVDRVRGIVMERLRTGTLTQELVARRLAMSARTLQRKLEDEGATFAGLLEEIRRELATLYLREPSLAVYEVALLLGYSEPSAFFRAFKRWTGTTPEAFRAGLARGA